MVTWIGIERQGQVVRLRDTNMDRVTRERNGDRDGDRDGGTGT